MPAYTYCRPEYCEDSRYNFTSTWDAEDAEYLAEDAAENFHDLHDGWESEWPIVFRIFDANGNSIGDFEVEREHRPVFSAVSV